MYAPAGAAAEIEAARRVVDPIQSDLIPAHVTLCREDEIGELSGSEIRDRLSAAAARPITLRFGQPEVFSGHGILLRCVEGEDEFRALRERLLGSPNIRSQSPHITLAHPRNPRAAGNSLSSLARLPAVTSITFDTVRLIEQEGNERWRVLQVFELAGG